MPTFQVRGVSQCSADSHFREKFPGAHVPARAYRSSSSENASKTYSGLTVGNTINFGGGHWQVVGVFRCGRLCLRLRIWCDAKSSTKSCCASHIFQSATVTSIRPRLPGVQGFCYLQPATQRRRYPRGDYYAKQSTTMTRLITVLGALLPSSWRLAPCLAR